MLVKFALLSSLLLIHLPGNLILIPSDTPADSSNIFQRSVLQLTIYFESASISLPPLPHSEQ